MQCFFQRDICEQRIDIKATHEIRVTKIHKCDVPRRPILSAIGTAAYKLANFLYLFFLPSPLIISVLRILFSFATEISSVPDSNSYFVASFGIKSLFTNIPLEETLSIATENYCNITRFSRNFATKLFKDLFLSSVKDIIFLCNKKILNRSFNPPFIYLTENLFFNMYMKLTARVQRQKTIPNFSNIGYRLPGSFM